MSDQPKFAFAAVPERAVDDQQLGNAAFRVLAALCAYADKDGHCFPGLGTIGGRLGISRQAVQQQVHRLESLGYVNAENQTRPNGSGTANRYDILFEPPGENDERGQPHVAGGGKVTLTGGQADLAGGARPELAPSNTPLNTPINNILPMPLPKGKSPPSSGNDLFPRFWQHYPKKVDKGEAEKAFRAAIKETPVEDILARARRYADQVKREGTPRKYIRGPARWLRAKPWLDEDESDGRDDPDDCFKGGETVDSW